LISASSALVLVPSSLQQTPSLSSPPLWLHMHLLNKQIVPCLSPEDSLLVAFHGT
jgi:hypothetical protein